VLKRIPSQHAKLEPIYSDIIEVIEEHHPTYLIQEIESKQLIQAHVSQLRKIKFILKKNNNKIQIRLPSRQN